MPQITLIFTHFGYSKYLEYTLLCARKTNPAARLVLLGDDTNIDIALRNGWQHYLSERYVSQFHERFNKAFRHVQGRHHRHIKNNQDWLRYVFERWFFIEGFIREQEIDTFWHFDSDTMILDDLYPYLDELSFSDFTVQCNGTCLNGMIRSVVVTEYCEHICKLFEDSDFLGKQQFEFNTVNTRCAFTEMRAFDDYKRNTSRVYLHLLEYKERKVFDDCICQDHQFSMCKIPSGEKVKRIYSRNSRFYGTRGGYETELISLNLSWVPDYLFVWVIESMEQDQSIENIRLSVNQKTRALIRNFMHALKKFFKHGAMRLFLVLMYS